MLGVHRRRLLLLPFSGKDVEQYIAKRVNSGNPDLLTIQVYQDAISSSGNVQELTRNPFILRLFVDGLPALKSAQDLQSVRKYDIYAAFVTQWLSNGLRRLTGSNTGVEVDLTQDSSVSVTAVVEKFDSLSCELASEMFKENCLYVKLGTVMRFQCTAQPLVRNFLCGNSFGKGWKGSLRPL
jgi:hypothetical protein